MVAGHALGVAAPDRTLLQRDRSVRTTSRIWLSSFCHVNPTNFAGRRACVAVVAHQKIAGTLQRGELACNQLEVSGGMAPCAQRHM
jgi:hypothetical protein